MNFLLEFTRIFRSFGQAALHRNPVFDITPEARDLRETVSKLLT